jgi:hypothetical protein
MIKLINKIAQNQLNREYIWPQVELDGEKGHIQSGWNEAFLGRQN